jgi:hypothetical protein
MVISLKASIQLRYSALFPFVAFMNRCTKCAFHPEAACDAGRVEDLVLEIKWSVTVIQMAIERLKGDWQRECN